MDGSEQQQVLSELEPAANERRAALGLLQLQLPYLRVLRYSYLALVLGKVT